MRKAQLYIIFLALLGLASTQANAQTNPAPNTAPAPEVAQQTKTVPAQPVTGAATDPASTDDGTQAMQKENPYCRQVNPEPCPDDNKNCRDMCNEDDLELAQLPALQPPSIPNFSLRASGE